MAHCIYRIVCFANGKVYVGQTNNDKRRYYNHFIELRNRTHKNSHLQRAFDKYGRSAFYFEVIERDIPFEQIGEREEYWIAHFDSYHNGFNQTPGGCSSENTGKRPLPCTWNGVSYPSRSVAAQSLGISTTTLGRRLQKGYTTDQDIRPSRFEAKPCMWEGVEYESLSAAARALGVSSSTMYYKLHGTPQPKKTNKQKEKEERTKRPRNSKVTDRFVTIFNNSPDEWLSYGDLSVKTGHYISSYQVKILKQMEAQGIIESRKVTKGIGAFFWQYRLIQRIPNEQRGLSHQDAAPLTNQTINKEYITHG